MQVKWNACQQYPLPMLPSEKRWLVQSKSLRQNQLSSHSSVTSKQLFINEFFKWRRKQSLAVSRFELILFLVRSSISRIFFSVILSCLLFLQSWVPHRRGNYSEDSHKFCSLVTLSNVSPNLSIPTNKDTARKKKIPAQPEVLDGWVTNTSGQQNCKPFEEEKFQWCI